MGRVGEAADGRRDGRRGRPARVHEVVPDGSLRRRGARVHAEGPGEDAACRVDADRLRVCGAHGRRASHRRREGQRAHRPAALHAQERRLRRDPHCEAGPRAVTRLAVAREELARAEQDPAVVLARDARRGRAQGPRVARAGAEGSEPAVREAARVGDARAGDSRDRVQEGRRFLFRARFREAPARRDREQGRPALEDGAGRRRSARSSRRRRRRRRSPVRRWVSSSPVSAARC